MKNYNKILVLSISLLFVGTSILPIISSQSICIERFNTTRKLNHRNNEMAEVQILQYCENGSIIQTIEKISVNDALDLANTFHNIDSLDMIFQKKNTIFEEDNFAPKKSRLSFIRVDDLKNEWRRYGIDIFRETITTRKTSDEPLYNFFCSLKFKLIGFGFVLGMHGFGIPTGFDPLGIFCGFGTVDTTGGLIDDQHLSGFCLGGFICFVGVLIIVMLPFISGPIIIGNGYAVGTFWTEQAI